MDANDAYVGQWVQFRTDFSSAPYAAVVTEVGSDQISLNAWYPGHAYADCRTGVRHSSHRDAQKQLELNPEGGIWDFAGPGVPKEIDHSKEEPKKAAPKRPSVVAAG